MKILKVLGKIAVSFLLVIFGLVIEANALTYLPLYWAAAVFILVAALVGWGIYVVTE